MKFYDWLCTVLTVLGPASAAPLNPSKSSTSSLPSVTSVSSPPRDELMDVGIEFVKSKHTTTMPLHTTPPADFTSASQLPPDSSTPTQQVSIMADSSYLPVKGINYILPADFFSTATLLHSLSLTSPFLNNFSSFPACRNKICYYKHYVCVPDVCVAR